MGEVKLFLKGERCRDPSDSSVFGYWAQNYAAASLSAIVEHRGAIEQLFLCARLRGPDSLHQFFPKLR